MSQPHYSWGESVRFLLGMWTVGFRSYFGHVGEQKNQSFCRQLKANPSAVQLVTQSQYVLSYLGSLGILVPF